MLEDDCYICMSLEASPSVDKAVSVMLLANRFGTDRFLAQWTYVAFG